MKNVCFCKPGIMSQCEPCGNEPRLCEFFIKHSYTNRCTHLVFDINCDSHRAQMAEYQPDADSLSKAQYDQEVEAYDLLGEVEEMLDDVHGGQPKVVRRTCMGCINFYGCPALPNYAAGMGKSMASLIDTDYWNIGSQCTSFATGGA